MPVVEGRVLNTALDPVQGIVTLRLITSVDGSRPPAFLGGGVTVISQVQPDVDVDGNWSVDVISNFDPSLLPTGTYYEVVQQAPREPARGFAIQVPYGAGPYDVDVIIVDPPGSITPSTLGAHLGANPAHDADHVGFVPTGVITATRVQGAIEQAVSLGRTFVHHQTNPASSVTVSHNLGFVPSAYVVESTGDDLDPGRSDPDLNTTILDFDGTAVSFDAHFS